ncbi:hypothetical protein BDK51DRAFT_36683 [Blyttiomyces helicus]|uniref:Uncharacterized protein n=1 Tax=Blyttiomyces helicus TaxID=388810 RepID=A0A4P9WDX3_9FUNG|nr:hypothetical protein BDK51DRAFT_36683 [Blyttiomyces helicus]|eukprot:RKO89438.1 hypothetical protein BDK51DRAFT_36683 [Blyttiomyces helicus]
MIDAPLLEEEDQVRTFSNSKNTVSTEWLETFCRRSPLVLGANRKKDPKVGPTSISKVSAPPEGLLQPLLASSVLSTAAPPPGHRSKDPSSPGHGSKGPASRNQQSEGLGPESKLARSRDSGIPYPEVQTVPSLEDGVLSESDAEPIKLDPTSPSRVQEPKTLTAPADWGLQAVGSTQVVGSGKDGSENRAHQRRDMQESRTESWDLHPDGSGIVRAEHRNKEAESMPVPPFREQNHPGEITERGDEDGQKLESAQDVQMMHQVFKLSNDHVERSYDETLLIIDAVLKDGRAFIKEVDFAVDLEREYQDDPDATVVYKNQHTGKDCVTVLIRRKDRLSRRYKVYNKLAQSWQTQNNTSFIGAHVHTVIEPYDSEAAATYQRVLPIGWCRVECTFYDVIESLDFELEVAGFVGMVLHSRSFFQCSVANQWRAFAEHLTRSMIVASRTTGEVAVGLRCNTDTRWIGGALTKISRSQLENKNFEREMVAKYSYRNGGIVTFVWIEEIQSEDTALELAAAPETFGTQARLTARSYRKLEGPVDATLTVGVVHENFRHGMRIFNHPTETGIDVSAMGYPPQPNIRLEIATERSLAAVQMQEEPCIRLLHRPMRNADPAEIQPLIQDAETELSIAYREKRGGLGKKVDSSVSDGFFGRHLDGIEVWETIRELDDIYRVHPSNDREGAVFVRTSKGGSAMSEDDGAELVGEGLKSEPLRSFDQLHLLDHPRMLGKRVGATFEVGNLADPLDSAAHGCCESKLVLHLLNSTVRHCLSTPKPGHCFATAGSANSFSLTLLGSLQSSSQFK